MCAGDIMSTSQAGKIGGVIDIKFSLPLKELLVSSPAKASGRTSSTASTTSGEEDPGVLFTQLRKTKMCKFHLAGGCRDGGSCAFAHSKEELHSIPNLTKTKLCQAFLAGGCDNPACTFAHGKEDIRVSDQVFKKSLCSWFARGQCRNGAKCRFAHGREELSSPQALKEEIARMSQQMAAMGKQLCALQQRVQHQAPLAAPETRPAPPKGPKWLLPPQHRAPPGLIPAAVPAAAGAVAEPRWLKPPQWA